MSDMTGWMTEEEFKEKRQTDIGPPHFKEHLPPVIAKNYGKWKYHEKIDGGTMVHHAEGGDKVFTVRESASIVLPAVGSAAGIRIAPA